MIFELCFILLSLSPLTSITNVSFLSWYWVKAQTVVNRHRMQKQCTFCGADDGYSWKLTDIRLVIMWACLNFQPPPQVVLNSSFFPTLHVEYSQIFLISKFKISSSLIHLLVFCQRKLAVMISWKWTRKERGQTKWEKTFES